LGIVRSAGGLERAMARLDVLAPRSNAALVARLIADAAWRRQESRGAHLRMDFPAIDPTLAQSSLWQNSTPGLRFAA
jgi:L-aspartate oxidase